MAMISAAAAVTIATKILNVDALGGELEMVAVFDEETN